ncbi:hypothetical protein Dda_6096 [Drechslerella dactyloides]|uniref:Adhesin domain-containing protein n=1 Tax=Drechslerella dactyloides TaxID=74499 RepID=A0AAD6IV69_DREDA|nr:hypothetical protein Dda_6096 [Drechslerella dactyloides]
MDRGDHPPMEDYQSTNPYITDVPEIIPMDASDIPVADGYFGGRHPGLSSTVPVINPYITTTTETTAEMTVTDGYFNGRPHQQLPVVHLADEEPVKTAMPELHRHVQGTEEARDVEDQPRLSQDDSQTVFSRISFASERSTLPPSYTSRRVSYEEDERDVGVAAQQTEVSPLVVAPDCSCGHPQCITCVVRGLPRRQSGDWRRRKCTRGCRSGHKKARKFKFCCSIFVILAFTWALFGGLMWKRAASRFKESLAFYERVQCNELLPETYEESFTVPINTTLSSFSLSQSVVYEKQEPGTSDLGGRISVEGFIDVEQASEDDKVGSDEVFIKVEYQVSDETIFRDVNVQMTEDGVAIKTNRYPSKPTDKRDVCVFFRVSVKFPRKSSKQLSQFAINTEQLSINLRPSLSLKVLDKAMLSSVTGNIWSKARKPRKFHDDEKRHANFGLQAKRLLVETTTGNIRGVWGLADYASMDSKSGNVDVGVMSVTSLPDMGTTTDLSISTVSGDVAVHSVSDDGTLGPFRHDLANYNTRIRTVSGDVIGQYLLGSHLSIQTISGEIEADILPISPASAGRSVTNPITIETDTKSGRAKMTFLEATDAKVMTEPRPLLHMRRVQTVINWLDEKRKKLWQLIQKHCGDSHPNSKDGIRNGHVDASDATTDVEPLYVDPEDTGLAALAFFKATHTTVSGDAFFHYPAAFEGRIKATTLTGEIDVGGDDVRIVRRERNGPVGRVVEAVHGTGEDAVVESKSISGDIRICVGDARF